MKNKTCCITGHRPKGFPWDYSDEECALTQEYLESLACQIYDLMRKGDFTHFISGGALGVDIDFAEIVIGLRDNTFDDITLELAVPCPNQQKLWSETDKERYSKILEQANIVTNVSDKYTPSCLQKRNEYMVNKSDLVLAFWNGKNKGGTFNTITYATKIGKTIDITHLRHF